MIQHFLFKLLSLAAMNNQDTLQAVQRGYRMEKPNYPGNTTPENLEAIYNVMSNFTFITLT